MIGHHSMELTVPEFSAVLLGMKHDASAQRAALATLGTSVIDNYTLGHFPTCCNRRAVSGIHCGMRANITFIT